MRKRLIERVDRLHTHLIIHKLGAEDAVLLVCFHLFYIRIVFKSCGSPSVGKYLNMLFGHVGNKGRQISESAAMDDERVESVAHTHAARLGIGDDAAPHVEVAILVKVGMYHAGTRLDDRHASRVAHKANELFSSTRNAEVNISHSVQHVCRCLMCGGQQAHHIGAYSLLAQHLMNDVDDGSIAAVGILAALEHTGVAALETKREHIEANIRACLVDYANHTERHTHLAQTQAVRQRALRERMAEGRWQRCHMTHVGSNAFKALRGEHQSVIQRVRLVHALQIVGVGIEQGVCVVGNGIGHSQQHLVFCIVINGSKRGACRLHLFKYLYVFCVHLLKFR